IDFRERMRKRFGLPVGIENDANAATYAEFRFGAAREVDSMVMLTLGTGCGGGAVVAGQLFRGWAEFGHIVIVYDGLPCQGSCTGRGHLEPYVTGVAAGKLAAEEFGPAVDAHRLVRLANEGEPRAIENLDDVTLRLLEELRSADVILCEDTRHTRVLLGRHGISGAKLLSYHEHNEAKRTGELLPRLLAGERVALVSDAGMPGISDPGGRLVGVALEHGVTVTVLPGPSAVDTALVAGGFAADRYQFVGFLPRGAGALAA